MWTTILSLLFGALPTIVGEIAKARNNALTAKTDLERIASLERVKALEAQRDVLVAESNTPWNTLGRAFLMAPFGLYFAKLLIWDKLLEWGNTDPLSPILTALAFAIYGFYFATDITRLLKR